MSVLHLLKQTTKGKKQRLLKHPFQETENFLHAIGAYNRAEEEVVEEEEDIDDEGE